MFNSCDRAFNVLKIVGNKEERGSKSSLEGDSTIYSIVIYI